MDARNLVGEIEFMPKLYKKDSLQGYLKKYYVVKKIINEA